MKRIELACVLIRVFALTIFVQALRMLSWGLVMNENGGGLRTLQLRQFMDFVLAIGLASLLWLNSPKLSKWVAND